ncbi:SMP-30/Gluconolactonase/LRE-like region, partial [Trinorchestia longiramus]
QITLSNGLAWSSDRKHMYYIDSLEFRVDVFDYDDASGKIENRRTVVDYKSIGLEKELPDGMTTDTNGNLWVANYFGRKVCC